MKRFLALMFSMAILSGAASAATVTITYAAVSVTPLPSTMLLITIGLLFSFIVVRKTRGLSLGRPLAAILLLAGLSLMEVVTRQQLITQASADIPVESMLPGGTLSFFLESGGEALVQNNTGSTQQITSVTVTAPDVLVTPGSTPQCTVGLSLANGASCYVQLEDEG